MNMNAATAAAILGMMLFAQSPAARADGLWLTQAPGTETPGAAAGEAATVRGTVSAVARRTAPSRSRDPRAARSPST